MMLSPEYIKALDPTMRLKYAMILAEIIFKNIRIGKVQCDTEPDLRIRKLVDLIRGITPEMVEAIDPTIRVTCAMILDELNDNEWPECGTREGSE
jgi:hypothetical protein